MAKMGRPTKLNEEVRKKAEEYIKNTDMPFIEELADMLGVVSDTVRNWEKRDEDFLGTIKRLEDKQRLALMKGGLSKQFNNTMCIFLLKANHGFIEAERQVVEFAGEMPKIFYPMKDGDDN